jgi:pyrroline-5-carboxylate reductase
MSIGFIGSGNMASALARGWGEPVLCTDSGSGRARALAEELGGEAVASNAELARRVDTVILAHKPAQLAEVAAGIDVVPQTVISLLARTTLDDLRAAYPGAAVARVEPNTPVALRQGVCTLAAESDGKDAVRELFERVGVVVELPEKLMAIGAACSAVGPAYFALVQEAWVDAAVRRGIPPDRASELVRGTMAGTAALLEATDTLALRRGVTSPGGTTARGLAALEAGGLRSAFADAMDAVVDYS